MEDVFLFVHRRCYYYYYYYYYSTHEGIRWSIKILWKVERSNTDDGGASSFSSVVIHKKNKLTDPTSSSSPRPTPSIINITVQKSYYGTHTHQSRPC
jgi:hypothetical protein